MVSPTNPLGPGFEEPTVGNVPPVAQDDNVTTRVGVPVTVEVLANDVDVDGNSLSIKTVTVAPRDGNLARGPGEFYYTPDDNFEGQDTFHYAVVDSEGAEDTAKVTIDVQHPMPVAENDAFTTPAGGTKTLDVLANDVEPGGDGLQITDVENPPHGTASIDRGRFIDYEPDAGFTGQDRFTYTLGDGTGDTDTATVTVDVTPTNAPPTAADDHSTTAAGTGVVIDVRANDSDPDGDALVVTSAGAPSNGTTSRGQANRVFYEPAPGFVGQDSFTYTVSDGNGGTDTATVSVDVRATNAPPVAVDDQTKTLPGEELTVDVLENDSDPDGDRLTSDFSGFTNARPSNGQVSPITAGPQAGEIRYTPDDGFTGQDTFTYTLRDGNGATDTATVTVDVGFPNTPPAAAGDQSTTVAGTPVTIEALANDSDPDNSSLALDRVEGGSNGRTTANPDGTVRYTPDDGFTGQDTFSYTVRDEDGGTDTATVTVDVARPQLDEVFRFYNTDAGGHFYTPSEAEADHVRNTLPSFKAEGVGFKALDANSPEAHPLETDVFRFYNKDAGGHFYTASEAEADYVRNNLDSFEPEGVGFRAFQEQVEGTIPVYRFYNTDAGGHFYTPSQAEAEHVRNTLPSFKDEGVGFFAYPSDFDLETLGLSPTDATGLA